MKRVLAGVTVLFAGTQAGLAQPPVANPGMGLVAPEVITATPIEVENAIGGRTLISLDLQNVTSVAAFEALSKAANVPIKVAALPAPDEISITLDKVPFWTAFDQLLTKTGMVTNSVGLPGQRELTVFRPALPDRAGGQDTGEKYPSFISGPVEMRARFVTRTQRVSLVTDGEPRQTDETATIDIDVRLDPKIVVTAYRPGAITVLDAKDDAGQSIMPAARVGTPFPMAFRRAPEYSAYLNLRPDSKRIALVRGTYERIVVLKREAWEIDIPVNEKPLVRRVGEYNYTVVSAGRHPNGEFEVRVRRAPVDPLMVANRQVRYSISNEDFALTDGAGKPLRPHGFTSSGEGAKFDGSIKFRMGDADGVTEPAKLTWFIPSDTRRIVVPWEFKDLPLP